MKNKQTVFSFLLVLSILVNALGVVTPALAAVLPLVDDFEAGLPVGTDPNGVAVGFATFRDNNSSVAISTTAAPPAPVPGAADPNTQSHIHAEIGRLITRLARIWRRESDQALSDHGLSYATAIPLLVLSRQGENVRQGVLADELGIEGPSLVRLIDLLQSEGLVERREDPTDRRAKRCISPRPATPRSRRPTGYCAACGPAC